MNLALTVMTSVVAVLSLIVSICTVYRTKKYADLAEAAAQRAEAVADRAEKRLAATVTVKKTQEIVPSRYSHDRTSTTVVTASPLTRSIYL